MLKALYMYSDVAGREACIGIDKMTLKFVNVENETEFKSIIDTTIRELKKPDTRLFKVSFYNNKAVPLEISFDDMDIEKELRETEFNDIVDNETTNPIDDWQTINEYKLEF